ncbi:MAG: hypothetical protein HY288_14340 [Planctomycetia bacterium]|nr:hypothetical protein [Planctomycetia bacterium]
MRIASAFCLVLAGAGMAFSAPELAADLPPIEVGPATAARLRWIQFSMVSGRVVAGSAHVGTNLTTTSTSPETRRRESLAIDISSALPNVQLELTTASEQLKLVLIDANRLSIYRSRPVEGYRLEFEQNPGQPLRLMVAQGGAERSWRAESFWHLWIAEPTIVRRHLIPVLELLHPSWQLASMGAEIEDVLVRRAQHQQLDRQRWARLVDSLASPKFAERQDAERELYRAGQVVLPYLQNLDRNRLDAEQAHRIREIVNSLSAGYKDSVDRIATWLSGDERVWLSLLSRGELAKRRVAAAQLGALVDGPIDFDPAASDAERQVQLERLQLRLQKPEEKRNRAGG